MAYLVARNEVETIFEGHIACFVDVLPEFLVGGGLGMNTVYIYLSMASLLTAPNASLV